MSYLHPELFVLVVHTCSADICCNSTISTVADVRNADEIAVRATADNDGRQPEADIHSASSGGRCPFAAGAPRSAIALVKTTSRL